MAWAAVLAVISMGTVLGGGGGQPPLTESFRPAAVDGGDGIASGRASATDPTREGGGGWFASLAVEPGAATCMVHAQPPVVSPAPAATSAAGTAHSAGDAGATQAVAAFLGDSYSTGYNGFGLGAAGWPAIVSAALGLAPLNRAVAGTGFVNPGWTSQPIRTRLDAVIRAHPRVVFLAGGHNDRRYGAQAALAAAAPVIDRLHAELPASVLVIVGPIWQSGSVPAALRSLNDGLRQKAASIGVAFIDPVRGGWFAGAWQQLISADGIHPTNAGHRHIADLVLEALAGQPAFTLPPSTSALAATAAATASARGDSQAPGLEWAPGAPCPA